MKLRLLILLALAQPTPGHTGDTEPGIDEIVVTGEKPITDIRREIREVEFRLYSEFNRLNDKDEYDIFCRKHRPIGSQILRNECKARMYWQALEEHADPHDPINPDDVPLVTKVSRAPHHERALRKQMLALAKENQTLRSILAERKALLDEIEQRKKRE